jgi:hypothetical protein
MNEEEEHENLDGTHVARPTGQHWPQDGFLAGNELGFKVLDPILRVPVTVSRCPSTSFLGRLPFSFLHFFPSIKHLGSKAGDCRRSQHGHVPCLFGDSLEVKI